MDGQMTTSQDTQQSIQTPSPVPFSPSETPKQKRGILFEVIFVVAFLAVLFAILNYSNILPHSKLFPNQLGFLPHRQYKQQKQYSGVKTTPTITPIPSVPEYAKADTESLVGDIMADDIIPSNLIFAKHDVKNPYNYSFYGTGWSGKNGETFIPTIEYNEQEIVIDRQIIIHVPRIIDKLNASSSSDIIKEYFKIAPINEFACISLPIENFTSIFCESFWEESRGIKKGIYVKSPVRNLNETQIFYCEHYPGTPAYSWKSCASEFSQTGVTP